MDIQTDIIKQGEFLLSDSVEASSLGFWFRLDLVIGLVIDLEIDLGVRNRFRRLCSVNTHCSHIVDQVVGL